MIGTSYHSIIVYKQQPENEINLNNTKAHLTSAFLLQQPFVFFTLYFFASWDICLKAELEISLFTWSQSTQLHQRALTSLNGFVPFVLQFIFHYTWLLWKISPEENQENVYLRKQIIFSVSNVRCQLQHATLEQRSEHRQALHKGECSKTSVFWGSGWSNQRQPLFPQKPPLSSSNPSYHTEDPYWESQGTEVTFRKQRGVNCGSGAIPGTLPHRQPPSPPQHGSSHTF